MRVVIALVLSLLFLSGCSEIESGEIYNKQHRKAYESHHTQCVVRTNIGTAEYPAYMCIAHAPYTVYHADKYMIKIQKMVDGKRKRATYSVSLVDYERWNVGDQVIAGEHFEVL